MSPGDGRPPQPASSALQKEIDLALAAFGQWKEALEQNADTLAHAMAAALRTFHETMQRHLDSAISSHLEHGVDLGDIEIQEIPATHTTVLLVAGKEVLRLWAAYDAEAGRIDLFLRETVPGAMGGMTMAGMVST